MTAAIVRSACAIGLSVGLLGASAWDPALPARVFISSSYASQALSLRSAADMRPGGAPRCQVVQAACALLSRRTFFGRFAQGAAVAGLWAVIFPAEQFSQSLTPSKKRAWMTAEIRGLLDSVLSPSAERDKSWNNVVILAKRHIDLRDFLLELVLREMRQGAWPKDLAENRLNELLDFTPNASQQERRLLSVYLSSPDAFVTAAALETFRKRFGEPGSDALFKEIAPALVRGLCLDEQADSAASILRSSAEKNDQRRDVVLAEVSKACVLSQMRGDDESLHIFQAFLSSEIDTSLLVAYWSTRGRWASALLPILSEKTDFQKIRWTPKLSQQMLEELKRPSRRRWVLRILSQAELSSFPQLNQLFFSLLETAEAADVLGDMETGILAGRMLQNLLEVPSFWNSDFSPGRALSPAVIKRWIRLWANALERSSNSIRVRWSPYMQIWFTEAVLDESLRDATAALYEKADERTLTPDVHRIFQLARRNVFPAEVYPDAEWTRRLAIWLNHAGPFSLSNEIPVHLLESAYLDPARFPNQEKLMAFLCQNGFFLSQAVSPAVYKRTIDLLEEPNERVRSMAGFLLTTWTLPDQALQNAALSKLLALERSGLPVASVDFAAVLDNFLADPNDAEGLFLALDGAGGELRKVILDRLTRHANLDHFSRHQPMIETFLSDPALVDSATIVLERMGADRAAIAEWKSRAKTRNMPLTEIKTAAEALRRFTRNLHSERWMECAVSASDAVERRQIFERLLGSPADLQTLLYAFPSGPAFLADAFGDPALQPKLQSVAASFEADLKQTIGAVLLLDERFDADGTGIVHAASLFSTTVDARVRSRALAIFQRDPSGSVAAVTNGVVMKQLVRLLAFASLETEREAVLSVLGAIPAQRVTAQADWQEAVVEAVASAKPGSLRAPLGQAYRLFVQRAREIFEDYAINGIHARLRRSAQQLATSFLPPAKQSRRSFNLLIAS